MKWIRILALFTCNLLFLLCWILILWILSCYRRKIPRMLGRSLFLILLYAFAFKREFRASYNRPVVDFKECNAGKKIVAYFINLDRAIDRLKYISSQISKLQFPSQRISAVDGQLLSEKYIESIVDVESYKIFFKMSPEVGTIGCSLSHEKAWRQFLASSNEYAIIFEDDVQFDTVELSETIKSVVEKKDLWDIVGFELNHRGAPVKITDLYNGKYLAAYLTNVKHAGCYLINRKAAYKLIEKFYPIRMPLDHYFTAAWEFDLKFAGVEPRIVKQKFGNSQIKISIAKKIKLPKILILNALYNIQRSIIHAVYNFYYFLFSKLYIKIPAKVRKVFDDKL